MNPKTYLAGLAVFASVAIVTAPAAHAQIPGAGRAEALAKADKDKKAEAEKKGAAKAKPEDWKTTAPDTSGMNFKGQKNVLLAVATDENGKVTKADIAKTSGDAAVDQRVSAWALKHWTGPKSAKSKIPVTIGQ